MSEVWRDVVGYGGWYQVSDAGRLRSFHKGWNGRMMRVQVTKDGYEKLRLKLPGGSYSGCRVHRLVLLAFVGGPPAGRPQCGHRNGDPRDNRLSNLRWVSQVENCADKVSHGTSNRGVRHWKRKACPDSVVASWVRPRERARVTAARLGVSADVVYKIRSGKTWAHITREWDARCKGAA